MGGDKIKELRSSLVDMVELLDDKDIISIIPYSTEASKDLSLLNKVKGEKNNLDELISFINGI